MKIEIIDKWFESHKTLTLGQYDTLKLMYQIILDDNNKKNEEDQPESETSNIVKPNAIWTEDEDEIIKKYYPMLSAPEIKLEKLPHRSEQAIYDRAFFLKIKKSKHRKKEITQPSDQTKKEKAIEQSTKYCPKCKTVKSIAEFHKNKKSPDGLQSYCTICKLNYGNYYLRKKQKKDNDWTFKEENLLREKFFKIGFDKLLKLLPGKSEKEIQEKAKMMGMAL